MLLPSCTPWEGSYSICAAAPVLMKLKDCVPVLCDLLQGCEVVGGRGSGGCALIDAEKEILDS